MKYLIAFLIFFSILSTTKAAVTPDFGVYMRAGSGANGKGGGQECISNKGTGGNEFRLGNECGIYGEFALGASLLKAETENAPFWRLHSNFAMVYKNQTDWENGNTNAWVLRELFTEGGRVDGLNFYAWVGKRFYRWGDLHMNDFYAVDMSGPGGGIGGIKTDHGTWSLALIQNSSSKEINGNGTVISTSVGDAAKTSLHLRLDEMPSEWGKWSFWLAGGMTPTAKDAAGTTDYKSASGAYLAVKNNASFGGGNNELGLAAGQSVMSNLGSQGDLMKDCANTTLVECTVGKSSRIRLWNGYTLDTDRWSTQVALIYEQLDRGTSEKAKARWMSAGVRPMYWFTDHLSLAFQAGVSNVLDEVDGLGSRNLVRFTVAPQMSFGKGFYSRPALRAFYTRTTWGENNKTSAAGTSYASATEMDSFGLQTEIWF